MVSPSTDITLPSLGLPYGGRIPEGVVSIRPMRTSDEKLLAIPDPGPDLQTRMFNNLINSCVKLPSGMKAEDLTTTDRVFLFIQLRISSYGKQYYVTIKCPQCGFDIPKELDLSADLPIKELKPETYETSLSVTLENGDSVRFHLLTGRDEMRAFTEAKRLQKLSPGMTFNPVPQLLMACQLEEVSSSEGGGFTSDDPNRFLKAKAYVDNMLSSTGWELRDAFDQAGSGYTMKLGEENCPRCGNSFETEFTPSGDFFRPFRKKPAANLEGAVAIS